VQRCIADGVDVCSYIHWSLLDNFEWLFGYRPKFRLIAVDRKTQARTIKPSGRYLGDLARSNGSRDGDAIHVRHQHVKS
jgi:beta-glucosidase